MKYSEIVLEIKLKIENNVCNCFRIYTKFIQMYVMINKRSICIIYELHLAIFSLSRVYRPLKGMFMFGWLGMYPSTFTYATQRT